MGDLFDADATLPSTPAAALAGLGERLQTCGACRHGAPARVGVPHPERADLPLDWIKCARDPHAGRVFSPLSQCQVRPLVFVPVLP